MANPPYLLCDSDALFQLFVGNELRPLKELKAAYGIQPAIVPEVEIELRSQRNFARRFEDTFRKIVSTGTVLVLDRPAIMGFLLRSGTPGPGADATCDKIQTLGSLYYQRVGLGEAYTFAAGAVLQVPALSNDHSAIKVLLRAKLDTPSPIFRVFDLICFAFQIGIMPEKDCDAFRSALMKENEGLPAEFKNAALIDGTNQCRVRLCDSAESPIGQPCADEPPYVKRLLVQRIG